MEIQNLTLRFNKYDNAKELWEAILKTYGGNEATKKTKKNQLKQQYGNFKAEGSETLEQTFNRNRDDLETMSLDDLYNHLKVYELEVQKKAGLNSQNMAFISSSNTSSGKGEVPTASVPTASIQVSVASTDVVAASLSHDTICAYITTHSNGSQIKYEDITQIDEDDIEEMDIKWNLALLSMRANKLWKKTGKNITIQGSDAIGFDKSKVECFNCHKIGHFARECRAPRSQDRGKRECYMKDPKVEEPDPKALMALNKIGAIWLMKKKTMHLKNTENLKTKISKLNKELSDCESDLFNYKRGLSQVKARLVEFKVNETNFCERIRVLKRDVESQKIVKDKTGLPEFVDDTVTDYTRPTPSVDVSKDVRSHLDGNNTSVFELGGLSGNVVSKSMIKFVKGTGCPNAIKVNNTGNARKPTVKYAEMYRNTSKSPRGETWPRANYSQNNGKSIYTHKSMTPRAILLKSGTKPIAVNKPNMNASQLKMTSFKTTHSKVKRPFERKTIVKQQVWVPKVPTDRSKIPTVGSKVPTAKPTVAADLGNKGKAVKASTHWIWKPKENTSSQGLNFNGVSGILQDKIDDKGYWDSGCSRHMTDNISYLSEYEPYNGGYVSFGHGGGKITVCLKFVTKNSVLFTDSECLVLGKDFKIDDTHVLLRTPRQHNMYSIDLNNIVPHKNLTCLIAKASVDESMMWHRRLGHLNFKTMNKLVRNNLVKGLPSKSFKNDHTCIACLKGKQHKASCKTKLVNYVSKPLYTLHMDLFGPTYFSSLNHKWYCLVVIDDFSRCDNRGEFGNREMDEFCSKKAEAVSTACYVQNRVLVNKSQNKTPYELFNGRSPAIGFLRPFRCHVMILNTLDHLGKFDAKGYEGSGPNWLFDIDSLTNSMNYVPVVVVGTSSTNQDVKDNVSSLRFIALPNWSKMVLLMYLKAVGTNPTASSKDSLADQVEPVLSPTVESKFPTVSLLVPTVSTNVLDSKSLEVPASPTVETAVPTISTPIPTGSKSIPSITSSLPKIISREGSSYSEPLSLEEPKKIVDALKDESWVEAMQEELLLFKIHNVWVLVDCPKGVRPIGIKWVLKNKKDERGFTIYQMDLKSSFLYGTIDEEVYVMKPPGFQDPEFPDRVYKVEKAMYGLHQALRAWYDDIIFGSSNPKLCRELEALMHDKFKMSAMGELTFFLGLTTKTPMDRENPWGKDGPGKDVDLHLYRSMIRSLMYLTASRPDIMFAVCLCARQQVTPKECHLHAVKRIFSDYDGDDQDRKLTTRGYQFWGRRLISWQCKKQTIVATSTTKAEYDAAASGCGQVLWIQNQLLDYGTLIMTKLAFCDYHNMVAILEKIERNADFHQIVDFLEAFTLRYDLLFRSTVYVSHIRQFWSTDRIETADGETHIVAKIDGKQRTVSESLIRKKLRLKDEEGISSLPDTELFENLSRMGYNISPNQRFSFNKGQFSHKWKFLIHTIMQCISPKSTAFNEFSSNIDTAIVCLATNRTYNFSKMIFDGMVRNVKNKGTKKFLMYPRFLEKLLKMTCFSTSTNSKSPPQAIQTTPQETLTTPHASLPQAAHIPSKTTTPRRLTKRAIRISQAKALSPVANETAPLTKGDRHGEAFLTAYSLDAGHDRENITKTSTMPHESSPMVTSLGGDEGSLQHKLNELMEFCTKLQSQHTQMAAKIQSQDLEISQLKTRIKTLEDTQKARGDSNKSTDKGSESTGEMANVLSSIRVTNILAIGGLKEVFTTISLPVPPVSSFVPTVVATASEKDSTAAGGEAGIGAQGFYGGRRIEGWSGRAAQAVADEGQMVAVSRWNAGGAEGGVVGGRWTPEGKGGIEDRTLRSEEDRRCLVVRTPESRGIEEGVYRSGERRIRVGERDEASRSSRWRVLGKAWILLAGEERGFWTEDGRMRWLVVIGGGRMESQWGWGSASGGGGLGIWFKCERSGARGLWDVRVQVASLLNVRDVTIVELRLKVGLQFIMYNDSQAMLRDAGFGETYKWSTYSLSLKVIRCFYRTVTILHGDHKGSSQQLTRAVQGTLWKEFQRDGEGQSVPPEFDITQLEELFSNVAPKKVDSKEAEKKCPEMVHLIDPSRANSVEIMLTKVKMPLSNMTRAILAMDDKDSHLSILQRETFDYLAVFCGPNECAMYGVESTEVGFKLDTLLKLVNKQALNGKITLMNCLCK
ncbi:putative ribonuclease H-like domain-containing protein, partial [Tanacetum coccineum]